MSLDKTTKITTCILTFSHYTLLSICIHKARKIEYFKLRSVLEEYTEFMCEIVMFRNVKNSTRAPSVVLTVIY
jgi:hypothetical protein